MSTVKLLGVKLALKAAEARSYSGIPTARTVVTEHEGPEGQQIVVAIISAENVFGVPHALLSLRTTPAEARELGRRFIEAADRLDSFRDHRAEIQPPRDVPPRANAYCRECGWLVPADGVYLPPEYDIPAEEHDPHRCDGSACVSEAVCDALGEVLP